jgi:MoaA/NifB/PqqE/SkfB family radical SAM enzyme
MKVFQVNICGGEPFIRDDFLDFLNYAYAKGIVTCVSTNGTRIDTDLARHLGGTSRSVGRGSGQSLLLPDSLQ